jgi:hypothetical protein
MLAASSSDQSYIDGCRARMEARVAAYDAVVEAADGAAAREALARFEPQVFTFLRVSPVFLAEIEKRHA